MTTNSPEADFVKQTIERFARREATIGIIGQGYVGLPLGLVFREAGFRVVGFDVDPVKVEALLKGESYIRHIGPERVAAAVRSEKFTATADFNRLVECDAILICVPTPLGKHREPDNSYIHRTCEEIAPRLRRGQLVVLESTTYPGTTDEEVLPILEKFGLKCPDDFFLAFSPEREDPGNANFSTRTIPKVVGGINPASGEVAVAMYSSALERVVPVSSSRIAESCKLLENIYRSVNIALVNELKVTFDKMDIDIWEVIEAAKTKPFGFSAFYPGPGLGGHCIPLDPFYLSWKAAEYGAWTRFIDLAGEINTNMPHYVVQKTIEALNDDGKSLKGSKICVLGLSYKANIDDDRESPSYELLDIFRAGGAEVAYCDPYFPVAKQTRKHNLRLRSVPCTPGDLGVFDALVISTAHRQFFDRDLFRSARIIIDTRNVMAVIGGVKARVTKA